MLGNLHPKYRSSLRVIDLFIAVTVPIVEKCGLNDILQAFVQDLQMLVQMVSQSNSMALNGNFVQRFWHF